MLTILTHGQPTLMATAMPVTQFDEALHALAQQMLHTMQHANGVGIAAPQVNQRLQLFIMASNPNPRYPDAPVMAPQVVINPQIISHSATLLLGDEGCLSLPGERRPILRHETIEVRYQDLSGEWCQERLSGFIARIFQHEYDHLHGITLRERQAMQQETL
ncbi:peptide deformylase [Shewanella sp. YIC-542]|uniref:peptide deformylase n=1 Tax=Shewanella mytili TaxID=3377111 RepID=UPI00398EA723